MHNQVTRSKARQITLPTKVCVLTSNERAVCLTVHVEVNDLANDVGVPQQDQGMVDKVTDAKVNSDIPFGNN